MKLSNKYKWRKFILEIALFLWITLVTATWVILDSYEQIGKSKSVPVSVKEKITSAGKNIYKYVWRQYKYAE